jgi:hypothetical protein
MVLKKVRVISSVKIYLKFKKLDYIFLLGIHKWDFRCSAWRIAKGEGGDSTQWVKYLGWPDGPWVSSVKIISLSP